MFFRKKRRIQFTDKKHPEQGILSSVIGTVAIVGLVLLFIFSSKEGGHGGIVLGYAGVLNFLLSVVGFVLAVRCYKLEEIYYTWVRFGTVSNGLVGISSILLYVIGV